MVETSARLHQPGKWAVDPSRLDGNSRTAGLAWASAEEADVLVIGAGVTGAGCALDAAGRGLSVVVVEAGDVAVGTSSRSGKTFHGGLRYLEQLNFSLVRHAIHERDLMVRTLAPYISRPVPFLYPLTRRWERPYAGAGILIYDLFGLRRNAVPRHRHVTRRGALKLAPSLDGDTVLGGIQYHDVLMDDARHTMAVLRTAAAHGARVVTRAGVVGFLHSGDRVTGVTVRDEMTGRLHRLRAKVVINATGVWSDELQKLAGANTFSIEPAKGVHLLLRAGAIDSRTAFLARAADSVIVVRPWLGHWLVGTTDTPWDGPKDRPVAQVADVRYLLDEVNHYLKKKISIEDVLGVVAGLRPLLRPSGQDGRTTSALSRDHSVIPGPAGLVTIVGGKYTTYRLMAVDTVDAAIEFGVLRDVPRSVSTSTPLVGAVGYPALVNNFPRLGRRYGLPADQIERLAFRYGSLLEEVLAIGADAALRVPKPEWAGYLPAELIYAVVAEGAFTLSDVMTRRTHLAIELPDGGRTVAADIAALIAPLLGWDEATVVDQVRGYLAEVESDRAALEALRQPRRAS